MLSKVSQFFLYIIFLAHLGLFIWGVLGGLEYLTGLNALGTLQNPNFPPGTQFIHWLLASLAGLSFIVGYLVKWKHTPTLMLIMYACLTTLWFIETFDFMTKENRYILFAIEVLEYIVISLYLFKSQKMKAHFKK